MAAEDQATVVRTVYEAYNAREFDRAAALHAPDLELVNVATGELFRGRAGYLQYAQGWAAALPDSQVEIVRLGARGEAVVAEYLARGTHTGTLVGSAGQLPPTGAHIELHFCDVLDLREGQVHRVRTYYDTGSMLRQMGLFAHSPLHVPDRRASLGLYAEMHGSTLQGNRAVVQRFVEEVLNRKNAAAATELCMPNLAWHGGSLGELRDVASFAQWLTSLFASFPDLHVEVHELVAERDRVVARMTTRGTHHAEFLGIPGTGRVLSASGTNVYRVVGGRIAEEWWQQDLLGVMQQLDAVPALVRPSRMI